MKHLPHLPFLRSFEAAARLSSFTAAADELSLTQSAVSNHVRSLEEFIGRPLFVRLPRSLALTELGEAYLPSVRQALQQIDTATEAILTQPRKREVVVSCPTSLAAHWLAGAVRGFHAAHPEIQLTVHGTVWSDVEADVADVSITVCHEDELPADATRLWADRLAVICAPDFRVRGAALSDPAQLPEADLIRILGRLDYWDRVARHFGLPRLAMPGGLQTDVTALAIEWAAQGLGCAAVPRSLIGPFTARGLVIEPFAAEMDCPWLYCVRFKDRMPGAAVRLFKDWLQGQAAEMDR
ncbi:transcriptional regulator, LysR family [Cribrihabitans marinus]|uniref:Transcriptional regulator, LysR family n=1 Tax=Cribrihabitans marinus TaxID=1227549 RepID=A0A1H6YFA3_9RHOB|nr:LysR substrate-binding domain-containing protein [Cribrihabitans marinus]GGH28461.1 LysR family transcriptional regulator [Cribrihabitans marinus]SEJ35425.1 transcriptional regulator, LysR family [Cribrihabitans marinus]